jgi:hypothetical protein
MNIVSERRLTADRNALDSPRGGIEVLPICFQYRPGPALYLRNARGRIDYASSKISGRARVTMSAPTL